MSNESLTVTVGVTLTLDLETTNCTNDNNDNDYHDNDDVDKVDNVDVELTDKLINFS